MSNVKGPDTAPNLAERFECLVNRYQESILHMCYLYLCDKTLAEDAVQETFLKVYRTMDTFRGECSEKTWIVRIAMHTCYDINHAGWFRFMNRNVTPEMLPERASTSQDRDEELANAVMRLPRKLREVILLHYYQGLKVNEIADALNISHSSVSGRMKRGREKLKKCWKGESLMNEKISADEFRAALDRHLSNLKADPYLAQRIMANEEGEKTVIKKISASMVLAIVLICVLVTGALAAALGNWGMIDFWGRHSGHIPENADETISKEEIRAEAEHFICTIQESYYDGCILRMIARIEPKMPIMLLAEQELPADPMEENEEITIGEYAARQFDGRMAELSFYLATMDDESGALKRNEDGTASIYMEAYYPDELAERDIVAVVVTIQSSPNNTPTAPPRKAATMASKEETP